MKIIALPKTLPIFDIYNIKISSMDNLQLLFWFQAILSLVVLICFFSLCSNVSKLKKKFYPSDNFGAYFSMLVAMHQIEEAKKLLMEEISKDSLFERAFYYGGDSSDIREKLKKKYEAYLIMVNITLDFNKSDELISMISKSR